MAHHNYLIGHNTSPDRNKTNPSRLTALTPQNQPESPLLRGNQPLHPRAISGHPSPCAPVGALKRLRNHSRISKWICSSTSDIDSDRIAAVAPGSRREPLCYYAITASRVKGRGQRADTMAHIAVRYTE